MSAKTSSTRARARQSSHDDSRDGRTSEDILFCPECGTRLNYRRPVADKKPSSTSSRAAAGDDDADNSKLFLTCNICPYRMDSEGELLPMSTRMFVERSSSYDLSTLF